MTFREINEKLKPCRYCGGIAKISGGLSITPILDENGAYVDVDVDEGYGYTIQCSSCGCEIVEPWVSDEDDADEATLESVINKWNNSPSPWHTGTPTEEGCFYALQCKGHIHPEPYYGVVVNGKFSAISWEGDLMPLPPDLIAWQKIEPYKETD